MLFRNVTIARGGWRLENRAAGRGFTLIELLVVVAVIAILAAIAVPNLLEAQTRSKVSRAKADMRSLQTALESFAVDNNRYPSAPNGIGFSGHLLDLTKPVAYITSLPEDIFGKPLVYNYLAGGNLTAIQADKFGSYSLASVGPDGKLNTTLIDTTVYDPTNGTVSEGDIVFSHKTKDPATLTRLAAGS
ncbi:type II secretion system protein GspG [bacterium]|nr:type II secretion system protein GspG [bacterium]